jgi:hypothetical protein
MRKWLFPQKFLTNSDPSEQRGRKPARAALAAVGTCVALLVAAAPAQAEEPNDWNEWEITPFVGYVAGGQFEDSLLGTDRDIAEDNNFGVIFNAAVDYWRHYELFYSQQSTKVEGATPMNLDVQYLQIGGTVSNPEAERVIPYFGLTVGAARFKPDAGFDTETKLAFSIAGGFKVPITEHVGVRLDARAFVSLLDTDGNIFCVSDGGAATCRIRTKSDTLFQYSANLGVTVGF